MSSSTLDRLTQLHQKARPLQGSAPEEARPSRAPLTLASEEHPATIAATEPEPSTAKVVKSQLGLLREQCLQEQLESFYEEIGYLNSKFPGHSIRSLTDLAIDLLTRRSSTPTPTNIGIDPGIVPIEFYGKLEQLNAQRSTDLKTGTLELNDQGLLLWANAAASRLLGFELQNAVQRNFFTEVVPGTNNSLFLGRFKNGIKEERLDIEFNYVLALKRPSKLLRVHIVRDPVSCRNFIFVKEAEDSPHA